MENIFTLVLAVFSLKTFAAKVDTVLIHSTAMNKDIKTVIVTPDNYRKTGKSYPVIYLLHGYSDNYAGWVKKASNTTELSDLYEVILICPDAGYSSWYFDSPIDPNYRYESFVSKEVVEWVDQNYNTIKNRKGRAITGLSMGGHGALFLAFKHQDTFGAAGSTSGGVDIRPFPNNWDISKRIGKYSQFPQNWESNTVINLVHLLEPNSLNLIIDCGTEDFFYEVNKRLHQKLMERNIPHEYIERPGEHNWEYWNNSITYQVLYFANFFKKTGRLKKQQVPSNTR